MCGSPEAYPSGWSLRTSKSTFLTGRLGKCFSLLSMQCHGYGSLPRTIFSNTTVLWGPGTQATLATRARWSGDIPCVYCAHLPALVRLWKSVARGVYPQHSSGQERVAGSRDGDHVCKHLPALARERESALTSISIPKESSNWSLPFWKML